MIELGKIPIKDDASIVGARNKVRLLARDLGFDSIGATRLATITSEICRIIYKDSDGSGISVGFERLGEIFFLKLVFETAVEEITFGKAFSFF